MPLSNGCAFSLLSGKTYPKKGDTVILRYVAKFENGKVFENSSDQGKLFEAQIGSGKLIRGKYH